MYIIVLLFSEILKDRQPEYLFVGGVKSSKNFNKTHKYSDDFSEEETTQTQTTAIEGENS